MTEFKEALQRVYLRKHAIAEAVTTDEDVQNRLGLDLSHAPEMLFSGSDLDPNEVIEFSDRMGTLVTYAVAFGEVTLADSVSGVWIDGIITGLEVAKLRAQRDGQ